MKYKKNADGTDMLDNDGNPIPEENTNEETITPEEAKQLKQSLGNTVEELKAMRKKNADLAEELRLKSETPAPNENASVADIVKKVLTEEKMSNAKTVKEKVFEKFITENKEFHPDNDPTGLKREALETKLKRFNTDSVTDPEEYYDVIREAQLLLTGNDSHSNTSREIPNPYSSSSIGRMTPKPIVTDKLTLKERKLVDQGSATEEYILKLREKRPSYLAQLLDKVRD